MFHRSLTFIACALWLAGGWVIAETRNDAQALQKLIDDASRAGEKKVTIPSGTYHLSSTEGYCLKFSKIKDLEIDATGVELICVDRVSSFILFDRCDRVTMRGALLRHDPVPFSQGRIEAMATDRKSVDIRIAQGYPADLEDERFFNKEGFLNVFDAANRLWKRDVSDIYYDGYEKLGEGLFRFQAKSRISPKQMVAVGDLVAWRGNGRADITLNHCAGMSLLDLRIENGVGFCVHENGGEGGNFYRYTVTRGPVPTGADEAPLFACNADAFHSSDVRKGPTLEDCLFEFMDDDGVPIHGAYGYVGGAGDGAGFTLASLSRNFCRPGDLLKFYNSEGHFSGSAIVKEYAFLPGYEPAQKYAGGVRLLQEAKAPIFAKVTLDTNVPVEFGWLVANANAAGNGFAVRRCMIRHNRARGMLIKASDGVIEDCVIEGTTMAGIAVWPEMGYWNEADYSSNVVIRNNTVRDVAVWNDAWNPMAGALTIAAWERPGYVASEVGHHNVLVEGNRFEGNDGVNVLVSTSQDVRIINNAFVRPMHRDSQRGQKDGVDVGSLMWLTESSRVQVEGNSLESPGSFLKTSVQATSTVRDSQIEGRFKGGKAP